ncbi:MOSC domain-containing protein [Ilumatobacter nonamiensis]|uniref:MOSC domain-containing protein n=1 Tax=Ilumatobacter nonamiensis TaxID=467093 RepID=UPI000346AE18|nr:MOSC domain-containing protein [Ilumatobacter nonamiensis]
MIGVEQCDRCGFDRSQWNEQDATRTLAHAADFLKGWSADARPELVDKLEARWVDDLKAIAASVELEDKVHHLWHGLVSIADVRRAADDTIPTQRGAVLQVNASDGGVPKTAIDEATVGVRGVEGDVQAARVHHGRPWQALCIWSGDVIERLAADGHPIAPGCAGENVTVSGLDWAQLRGGTVIDIGTVRCQLSAPAVPCQKNARWFLDGDISLMDQRLHPESTRWYASVVRPGSIRAGDSVTVSPR